MYTFSLFNKAIFSFDIALAIPRKPSLPATLVVSLCIFSQYFFICLLVCTYVCLDACMWKLGESLQVGLLSFHHVRPGHEMWIIISPCTSAFSWSSHVSCPSIYF